MSTIGVPEDLLAQVVEAAPMGVVMIDATGTIQLVNGALVRMFGYPREELLGRSIEELLPERYRDGHVGLRQSYFADPKPRAMGAGRELYARRADGSEFPIEIGLSAVTTSAGTQAVATVIDISARKRLEKTFQSIVASAPYGLLMIDETGRIELCNARLERMFGYATNELIGRSVDDLLPERYRADHGGHRRAFAAAPAAREMGEGRDLMAMHKSGAEFPVEIGLNPVPGERGLRVLAAVTDISKRKQIELDLRQANAHLEEFSYVASHDLKSPIRGIGDLVSWLGEDLGDAAAPEVKHNLERIGVRVKRMERIIDDLLTYARAGRASTELTLVDPRALVDEIRELLPPAFEVAVHCTAAPFMATRTPLETVLRNLISNAVKHHDKDRGRIDITISEADLYCEFTVADDGPGIAFKARDRVFRMFQTATVAERGGSGIGLAVSRRLVEAHGGRITLDSAAATRGATFRFLWPRFSRRAVNE